MIIDVVKLQFN